MSAEDNDGRDMMTAETQIDEYDDLLRNWNPRDERLAYPQEIYRQLRERYPVAQSDHYGGFKLFSRYADVSQIASDYRTFSSASGISMPPYATPRPMMPVELDPPEQGHFRRALSPRLSVKRVAALETELRAVVRRLLEPSAAGDPFDFVQDFAAPYPILAFWREPFMGRPVEHPMVGDSWLTAFQHWSYLMHHDDTRGQEGTEMMHKYISVILDDRRKNPGDDIPTQLLTQEVGGRMLSEEEIHDTLFLLFSAGIETSAAALGNMLHFLAHHREARRALVEDPAIIPSAVEELLRHVGPSQCVRRTATTDTEVAGCPVKKGESVVIHWGAANLDEEAFERADEFDPTRSPNPHLAFGKGVHKCQGLHFARLELRVALEEVLAVAPDYEIAVPEEELEWKVGIDRALKSLPVRRGGA